MSASGLTTASAAQRRRASGPNEIPAPPSFSLLASIGSQLREPLIIVLLAASVLTLATGDVPDTIVIAIVVVFNTAVGVIQELRAERAVDALSRMRSPRVRVRRDGGETEVSATELVPGDVVLLGEGDVVPADGELLEATSLLVDESALTGESASVHHSGPRGETPGERLSSGTAVTKGRGLMLVTATGGESALGQIAAAIDTHRQPTPLQLRLSALGRTLALVTVALCAFVFVLGLVRGEPFERMLVTAVSLAVAAVPESLPAVVTVSLALGARRMAERHAIVRRLAAVETLGSVSVLGTDKTGTLTQGRMVVKQLWTPTDGIVTIDDGPAQPHGSRDGRVRPGAAGLLRAAALCNDAQLKDSPAGGGTDGMGDPMEIALLAAAERFGIATTDTRRSWPRCQEVPFDSLTRQMTTVHESSENGRPGWLAVTKGSPESVLGSSRPGLTELEQARARSVAEEMAGQGYRVLAFTEACGSRQEPWQELTPTLLGLVALEDPIKDSAAATLASCVRAGVVPVLLTGDHPATARAIAVAAGVLPAGDQSEQAVVTGEDISAGRVPDLTRPRVFARTTPLQKLDVVQAWRDDGAFIAMTGDGVNDGPALRRADIGVAMGHHGTEVARQAADLVLADDELGTVVAAIEEGRRVYANIRRFLVFGLSGGAAEILVMIFGPVVGLALPLLAAQILWINLITHGLTGIALSAEPPDPEAMEVPPRPPAQHVLGDGLWLLVLVLGIEVTLMSLAVGWWAEQTGRAWQTMLFLTLTALQLGVALGLRRRLFVRANPALPIMVGIGMALALAAVYLPLLRDVLSTESLPAGDAALALSTAVVGGLLGWVHAHPRPLVSAQTPLQTG